MITQNGEDDLSNDRQIPKAVLGEKDVPIASHLYRPIKESRQSDSHIVNIS